MSDVLPVREWLRNVGSRYDLIGMDPRFVGRSTPLDCGWPAGTWLRAAGLPDRASFEQTAAFEAGLARRCVRRRGDVLPYVTTRNTARDMDAIRRPGSDSYGRTAPTGRLPSVPPRRCADRRGPRVRAGAGAPATRRADWAMDRRHASTGRQARWWPLWTGSSRRPDGARYASASFRVDAATVRVLLLDGNDDDRDEANGRPRRDRPGARPRGPELAMPSRRHIWRRPSRYFLTGAESATGSVQAAIVCGDVAAPRNPEAYLRDIRAAMAKEPRFAPLTRNLGPCLFWPAPRGAADPDRQRHPGADRAGHWRPPHAVPRSDWPCTPR